MTNTPVLINDFHLHFKRYFTVLFAESMKNCLHQYSSKKEKKSSLKPPPNASTEPSQQYETMLPLHLFQCTQLMGNWSCLEKSPLQRYQGWEGGVNSGRDASEVKPLIMITNWSWLLERQAAAVGRPAFEVPPACCRVPDPLA